MCYICPTIPIQLWCNGLPAILASHASIRQADFSILLLSAGTLIADETTYMNSEQIYIDLADARAADEIALLDLDPGSDIFTAAIGSTSAVSTAAEYNVVSVGEHSGVAITPSTFRSSSFECNYIDILYNKKKSDSDVRVSNVIRINIFDTP